MTEKIRMVRGDTGPQIRLTLTDDITGGPLDLTGANGPVALELHIVVVVHVINTDNCKRRLGFEQFQYDVRADKTSYSGYKYISIF